MKTQPSTFKFPLKIAPTIPLKQNGRPDEDLLTFKASKVNYYCPTNQLRNTTLDITYIVSAEDETPIGDIGIENISSIFPNYNPNVWGLEIKSDEDALSVNFTEPEIFESEFGPGVIFPVSIAMLDDSNYDFAGNIVLQPINKDGDFIIYLDPERNHFAVGDNDWGRFSIDDDFYDITKTPTCEMLAVYQKSVLRVLEFLPSSHESLAEIIRHSSELN